MITHWAENPAVEKRIEAGPMNIHAHTSALIKAGAFGTGFRCAQWMINIRCEQAPPRNYRMMVIRRLAGKQKKYTLAAYATRIIIFDTIICIKFQY